MSYIRQEIYVGYMRNSELRIQRDVRHTNSPTKTQLLPSREVVPEPQPQPLHT